MLPLLFSFSIILIAILNFSAFIESAENANKAITEENADVKTELSNLDNVYTENFIAKNNYIDINGGFARLVDMPYLNEVVKLDNGAIIQPYAKVGMQPMVNETVLLRDYLSTMDTPYIYVQLPEKYLTDNDSQIPVWAQTYSNTNADELLAYLAQNGVVTMDIRAEMLNSGIDSYDAFFKTDHHWKIETALWAHTLIVQQISETLGADVVLNEQALNFENYVYTTYEDILLGSAGERTGYLYAGGDDVTQVVPNFETSFEVLIPPKNINISGSYEEVFINTLGRMNYDESFGNLAYLGLSFDLSDEYAKITNNYAQNDSKIFVIRDSFGAAIAPYLALHFKEVHLYDPRYGQASGEMLVQKLNEIQPDIVLTLLYPGLFKDEIYSNILPFDSLLEISQ